MIAVAAQPYVFAGPRGYQPLDYQEIAFFDLFGKLKAKADLGSKVINLVSADQDKQYIYSEVV